MTQWTAGPAWHGSVPGRGTPEASTPVLALHKLFEQTGTAPAVAVVRDAKLEPEVVNPYGGAIALGHPVGGTGAIRSGVSRASAAPSPKKGLIRRWPLQHVKR